jgi:hypothetical protein
VIRSGIRICFNLVLVLFLPLSLALKKEKKNDLFQFCSLKQFKKKKNVSVW